MKDLEYFIVQINIFSNFLTSCYVFYFNVAIKMFFCSVCGLKLLMFCVNVAGNAAFDFTCLLHTYLRVPDVTKAAVSNLRGCTFADKVRPLHTCC